MAEDPTIILKSMRDLQKFVGRGKSRENSQDDVGGSPRLKLSFSDSSGLDNETSFAGDNDLASTSFFKKHQQSIVGFDVVNKLREKDVQILDCKTNITVLEAKIENLKTLYRNARIDYESETEKYKAKQFQDKETIENLEEKVRKLSDKKQSAYEEMLNNRESGEFHRIAKEKSLMERNKLYSEKIEELKEKVSELEDTNFELMNLVNEKSSSLEMQENENKRLEENLSNLQSQLTELRSTNKDLDVLKIKLLQAVTKNKELESRLECLREQENRLESFEDTIKKLPALKKELEKLKEENHMHKITRLNIDMLKEQLTSAETRLERMETKCKDLTEENATLVTLRDLSEQYESLIRKEFQLEYLPPASDFLNILRNLKKKDEEVEQSLSELKASIESHSSSKDKQQQIIENLKSELEKCHFEMTKNVHIIKRLQRKIFYLSKERDSLKGIIESYQSEATLNPSAVEQELFKHLEAQLDDYKSEVSKLEAELNEAQQLPKYESKTVEKSEGSAESSCSNKGVDSETLSQLREENDMLKAQMENYGNLGVHDSLQTKVIHFRDNPLEKAYNERKCSYDKLTQENEALRKRVQLLEEGVNTDLTEKVGMKIATDEVNPKIVKELEEKVNTVETRNKRLMEVYKETSKEMRDIVYQLLGYRIDFGDEKLYTLSSMYAESSEDCLLFKQKSKGQIELLKNDFTDTLEDLVEDYLNNHDNPYPAFLSAVTLRLHSMQTKIQCSSDQEEYEGLEEDEEPVGDEEEEEYIGEEEEEEEENIEEPAAKRPRRDLEEDEVPEEEEEEEVDDEEEEEEDNEEEEDDDDELICLD